VGLDAIEYAPEDRRRLDEALTAGAGLCVVSGPVGSGITTVLYACVQHLNRPEYKVITVEDPIAIRIDGVCQIPVRPQLGMTSAAALRAVLRSAPDAIMVGEIRDRESLVVAMQAALDGHLVLIGLHTRDAATALQRMVDLSSEAFAVAETSRLVLGQHLIRKVCAHCAEPATPSQELAEIAERLAREGGLDWDALERNFVRPKGCPHCAGTGYRGRFPIAETLRVSAEIRRALRRGDDEATLQRIAISEGMTSIAADGVRRAAAGLTTLEEVVRVLGLSKLLGA
jgi:type II secretory ATPase GspE/PulE/Tfp pilus assembly ATPase PilB-like protein